MVMQLKKKPITVEAVKYTGDNQGEVKDFCGEACDFDENYHPIIVTAEGEVTATPGDLIVKGVAGEFYPVKPDIAADTFEQPDMGSAAPALEKHWNKEEREAAPASDWGVPGKKKLRISDARHVRLAWAMVDRVKGLSDAEKASARKRILAKAHTLGIDTADWGHEGMSKEDLEAEVVLLNQETVPAPVTPGAVNVVSYLLTHLAEEASETTWAACKASRYGIDTVCPIKGDTGRAKIVKELAELKAVLTLLNEELESQGIAPIDVTDADFTTAFQARIDTLKREYELGRYTLPADSTDE